MYRVSVQPESPSTSRVRPPDRAAPRTPSLPLLPHEASFVQLQRTIGNRAVQRLLNVQRQEEEDEEGAAIEEVQLQRSIEQRIRNSGARGV
jgi:hypothetical protein